MVLFRVFVISTLLAACGSQNNSRSQSSDAVDSQEGESLALTEQEAKAAAGADLSSSDDAWLASGQYVGPRNGQRALWRHFVDPARYEYLREKAKSELIVAKAEAEKLRAEAGVTREKELLIRKRRFQLEKFIKEVDEELKRIKNQIAEARLDNKRMEGLVRDGKVTGQRLDSLNGSIKEIETIDALGNLKIASQKQCGTCVILSLGYRSLSQEDYFSGGDGHAFRFYLRGLLAEKGTYTLRGQAYSDLIKLVKVVTQTSTSARIEQLKKDRAVEYDRLREEWDAVADFMSSEGVFGSSDKTGENKE